MIKLVHIISNLSIGGAQVLLFDILSYLKSKNDIDITVITIDSGEYKDSFIKNGIKLIDLNEKGLINTAIYFKLKKILSEIKPLIVHTHLNKADFYGRIAAKKANVPFIYSTCHNYSTHHKGADIDKISIYDRIDNFVIKYSDSNLIAISEVVKKYLINRNNEFSKSTELIYNGVNTGKEKYLLDENELANFRYKNNIEKDDFVILISGRLEIQKGHSFFLDSVKDFLKEKRNIKVLILGDGSLKHEIENKIVNEQLNEFIKVIGFQQETEKFIEISDLICVPSLWEGFGLVIIEGMIKGKIVLASNTGGIPEIIKDGETGFLFEVNDKINLLEKLNYIYENYNNLFRIKRNSIELVKEKFDIEKNSESYYQSYLKKIMKHKI